MANMADATEKSFGVEEMITAVFGKDRVHVIANDECMTCDGTATEFKAGLSMKEYTISGMCQACQDKVFE